MQLPLRPVLIATLLSGATAPHRSIVTPTLAPYATIKSNKENKRRGEGVKKISASTDTAHMHILYWPPFQNQPTFAHHTCYHTEKGPATRLGSSR